MKTIFGWTAGVLVLGATLTTQGGLVALWTFDDNTANLTTGVAPNSPGNGVTYDPSGVTASFTGTGAIGDAFGGGGTTVNDPRTTPSATYCYTGGQLTIKIDNASGLSGFTLSYAAGEAWPTGGSIQTWRSSTDGVNFNGLPDSSSLGITYFTWLPNSVSFSSASSVGALYFRDTISGTPISQINFDNFQLTAVPEPINYALAAFGLCVGGISFGRRFVRKLTRA